MKYSLYLLLTITLLFCSAHNAQAGFVIKKHIATEKTAAGKILTTAGQVTSNTDAHHAYIFSTFRALTHSFPGYRRQPSEWVGIIALLAGVIGTFTPGVCLLAILMGVLGMGRRCRTRGLAISGFMLGMIELIVSLLIGGTLVSLILL